MQHASCFVQLSGDLGTMIAKSPVTPAEVILIRAIHGDESVSKIELLDGGTNDKSSHAQELQRLRDHYTAMTEDGKSVIDKVFPGHAPQLPTTFREIGIDLSGPKSARRADAPEEGQLSVADLKAQLDDWGVSYKGNASKAVLEALYDEAMEERNTDTSGDDR